MRCVARCCYADFVIEYIFMGTARDARSARGWATTRRKQREICIIDARAPRSHCNLIMKHNAGPLLTPSFAPNDPTQSARNGPKSPKKCTVHRAVNWIFILFKNMQPMALSAVCVCAIIIMRMHARAAVIGERAGAGSAYRVRMDVVK